MVLTNSEPQTHIFFKGQGNFYYCVRVILCFKSIISDHDYYLSDSAKMNKEIECQLSAFRFLISAAEKCFSDHLAENCSLMGLQVLTQQQQAPASRL
jgi:hypothetical protein